MRRSLASLPQHCMFGVTKATSRSPQAMHPVGTMQFREFSSATRDMENSDQAGEESFVTVRETLLRSATKSHVSLHGWTTAAIVAAVQANYPHASLSLSGSISPRDMISYIMDQWNQQLASDLRQQQELWKESDATMVDKITHALKLRLEYEEDFIKAGKWHEGMALGISTPEQAQQTTEELKRTIDILIENVFSIEEKTKMTEMEKVALGAIFVATELHMLSDNSPEFEATWLFLRQRVEGWARNLHQSGENLQQIGSSIPAALEVGSILVSTVASGAMSVLQIDPNMVSKSVPRVGDLWALVVSMQQANVSAKRPTIQNKTE